MRTTQKQQRSKAQDRICSLPLACTRTKGRSPRARARTGLEVCCETQRLLDEALACAVVPPSPLSLSLRSFISVHLAWGNLPCCNVAGLGSLRVGKWQLKFFPHPTNTLNITKRCKLSCACKARLCRVGCHHHETLALYVSSTLQC